jgi:DHA2 family multidrug resistance protein
MAAMVMQVLDTTIANVALPHMQTALGATSDTITWVLTSYIVASAIAIPITGWLSDRVGSRNLFLFSVGGFVLSSALCGAAQNLEQLVLFRVLQGVTSAFLGPLSQTVMLDINPPGRQAKAMAVWGMGVMVGPIMGPLIGGWLTENFEWRWCFYVNLPIGVLTFALLWWLLPSRPIRKRAFDMTGFILFSIGISALQLMLDRGQTKDWFQSQEIWVEALAAFITLWMFAVHLGTASKPMFDRSLWKNRNLVTGLFFMQVIGVVMMASMALLPPMMQGLYGYSVMQTGEILMARGVGVLVTMAVSGQLIQRNFDARWVVGLGLMIATWSLWQMTTWTLDMSVSAFVVTGFIQGFGMGLVFMPLNNMAFQTLSPQFRTEGSSLLNLSRNIGASVGISIVTTVLARELQINHADLGTHLTTEKFGTVDPYILQLFPTASDAVMGMINGMVSQQAAMIGYLDVFRLMTLITALSVPLVLLLKRKKGVKAEKPDPGAAGH